MSQVIAVAAAGWACSSISIVTALHAAVTASPVSASRAGSFDKHDQVYRTIFTRCGLKFVAVDADSGAMGGSQSQEFMVYTDAGEDLIASCPVCHYAANVEKATSILEPVQEMESTGDGTPELVSTPGCAAIADVAAFFKISRPPTSSASPTWRSSAVPAESRQWHGVATFLRGDHQVNETKLMGAIGAPTCAPCKPPS